MYGNFKTIHKGKYWRHRNFTSNSVKVLYSLLRATYSALVFCRLRDDETFSSLLIKWEYFNALLYYITCVSGKTTPCFVSVFLWTPKNVTQFVIIVDYICSFKVIAFCFLVKSQKARQTLKWKNSFGGRNRGPVEDNKENKILITHKLIIQSNKRGRPLVAHWYIS